MTLYISALGKHQMYFLMAKAGEKSIHFKQIFLISSTECISLKGRRHTTINFTQMENSLTLVSDTDQ